MVLTVLPNFSIYRTPSTYTMLDSAGRLLVWGKANNTANTTSDLTERRIERYTPSSSTWTTLSAAPSWTAYVYSRTSTGNFMIADGYSSGGFNAVTTVSQVFSSNVWNVLPNSITKRRFPLFWTDANGALYICGGQADDGSFTPFTTIETYSGGLSGTWSTKPTALPSGGFSMPTGPFVNDVQKSMGVVLDYAMNTVYVLGCELNTPNNVALWRYSIATDTWTRMSDAPVSFATASQGISLDRRIYTINFLSKMMWYNIDLDTWGQSVTNVPASMATCIIPYNNLVYGFGGSAVDTHIYVYDPAHDTVTATNDALVTPRSQPSLSFDGTGFYLAGGQFPGGTGTRALEYWVPDPTAIGSGITWGWGLNNTGLLGIGTSGVKRVPNLVLDPATTPFIAANSSDGFMALFIASDRRVYETGTNTNGGFGDGSPASSGVRLVPTLVPGLINIAKVRAGNACYALDTSGNLWGWGDRTNGQLATPVSGLKQTTPIIINTNVLDFDSDGNSVIVLKSGGVVQTVGLQTGGRLANGVTAATGVATWQTVTPVGSTVQQVVFGTNCCMLRRADGSVLAAGTNTGTSGTAGQLGVTANTNNATFFALPYTNASDIWATTSATWYRRHDNVIFSMGRNELGQLGTGTATGGAVSPHQSTPQQWVSPFPVGVALQAHGPGNLALSSIALGNNGLDYTWGQGTNGEMGNNGSTASNPTAISVNGLTGQLWVGTAHAFGGLWSGAGVLKITQISGVQVIG